MIRTHRRKLKSIIADIIANLLIMIAIFIIGLIVINLGTSIIVALHITYEQFRHAMIVICIVIAIIAVIKVLREPEGGEKDG